MSLTVSSFFQYYMFHSNKAETEQNRIISMITSIALGILTFGLIHIICFAAFYDRKIGQVSEKKATDIKSEDVFKKVIEEGPKEKATELMMSKKTKKPAADEDFGNSQSEESRAEISQSFEKASGATSVGGSKKERPSDLKGASGSAISAAEIGIDMAGKALKAAVKGKEKRKSLEKDPPPSKSHSALLPKEKKISGGTASSEEKDSEENEKIATTGGVDTMTASAKKIGAFLVSGTLTVNGNEDSSKEGKKDQLKRSRSATFTREKSHAHEDSSLSSTKKKSPPRSFSLKNLKSRLAEDDKAPSASVPKDDASDKSTEEKRKSAKKWFSIKNLKIHLAEEDPTASASVSKDDASDKSTEEKRKSAKKWFSITNLKKTHSDEKSLATANASRQKGAGKSTWKE